MTVLYLSASTDAVDASLFTKRDAVLRYIENESLDPGCIGAIGDSENDLPFLEIDGLGLVGAPANAQEHVKERVRRLPNSIVMSAEVLDGFVQFFDLALSRGIRHIVTDRDGVLIWKAGARRDIARLQRLLLQPDPPARPSISVLTGASVEQNIRFMREYALQEKTLCSNWLLEHPEIIWAENGSILIDVLTGKPRMVFPHGHTDEIRVLHGPFAANVLRRVAAEVLADFDLEYTRDPADQAGRVYVPQKETMLTLNIPHATATEADFRRTPVADRLRSRMLAVMTEAAEAHGFTVRQV